MNHRGRQVCLSKAKGGIKETFSSGKERALVINCKSEETELSFRVETDDQSIVDEALEKIPDVVSKADISAAFYSGKDRNWEPSNGKVVFVGTGVAATTDEVVVNGRKVSLTEDAFAKSGQGIAAGPPYHARTSRQTER